MEPTKGRLAELFRYDRENGVLTRRCDVNYNARKGDIVGCLGSHGYQTVNIDGKSYLVHRVIWILHYGEISKDFIDHIDGNKVNNRIENLREVTVSENAVNTNGRLVRAGRVTGTYC